MSTAVPHHSLFRKRTLGCAFAFLGSCAPQAPPWHVLVISLDTTRADHISCIGGAASPIQTPALDQLAKEGALFTQAQSAAATTLSAHTSLMTGTWPQRHGVVRNGFVMNSHNQTLAETLGARGYRTRAVLGSFALDSRFGFDQGFEVFDETFDLLVGTGGADQNQRIGERVTTALLDQVDQHGEDEALFLFGHYFDPHAPYDPPLAQRAGFGPHMEGITGDPLRVERAVRAGQARALGAGAGLPGLAGVVRGGLSQSLLEGHDPSPGPKDDQLIALYGAEVVALDCALGRLFEGLKERGLWDRTIVIVTADHGETFNEHADRWNHGLWVHGSTVHVPLIVRVPQEHPWASKLTGRRIDQVVSTIDVYPTILALLGMEPQTQVQGVNLGPLLEGLELDRGAVFSEATQPWMGLEDLARSRGQWANSLKPHSVREGRWRYIRAPYLQWEQLYDISADPSEQNNLASDPALADVVFRLRNHLQQHQGVADPLPSSFNSTQIEETRIRLEALGYGGGKSEGSR